MLKLANGEEKKNDENEGWSQQMHLWVGLLPGKAKAKRQTEAEIPFTDVVGDVTTVLEGDVKD